MQMTVLLQMPRKTLPLSNTEIKNAKPKEKEYNLSDGEGLSLRVKPTGSKAWIFNYYQPYSKSRKNISLGTYPEVSLSQARQHKDEMRRLLAQNIDPKEHREQQHQKQKEALSNTFEKITAEWLDIKRPSITKGHADSTWNSMKLHLFPQLGNYPIQKLTAPKVITVLKPLAAKGNFETIRRLCQRINEVMIYAVNIGLIRQNDL